MEILFEPEIKLILYCSRTKINEDLIPALKKILEAPLNWDKIIKLSIFHGVAPLLYHNIVNLDFSKIIPERNLLELKNYYYSNLKRNIRLWQEFLRISDCFQNQGIEFIPLKGIILGDILYHNPALRPIKSDIDILIKEKDIQSATKELENMNYQISICNADYFIFFSGNYAMLDLHWHFLNSWLNHINIYTIWQRAKSCIIEGKELRTLSFEDTLLTLTLQLRYDIPHFNLLHLCDINEILYQYESSLNWDYILKSAKDYQLCGPLYFNLYLCQKLFFSPLPEDTLKKLVTSSPRRKLLSIFLGNDLNFIFDRDLECRKELWRIGLLKFLMTDSFKDCLKIVIYKIKNI